MRNAEREKWMALVAAQQEQIAKMADRIQHPERAQVDAGEIVEHDPPQDAAELAHVGTEVPEFVVAG